MSAPRTPDARPVLVTAGTGKSGRRVAFIDVIGRLTGTPVRYLRVSPEEMAGGLQDAGLPADEAVHLVEVLATVLDGRNAHLADGVARALGRPPRDVVDVLADRGKVT